MGHGSKTLINTLGDQTAMFMPGSAGADQESSLPVYGAPYRGEYGTVATVARLTNTVPREGSEANGMSDKWRLLRQRASAPGRRGSFYIRGHLLNRELGGTGDDWTNLTPLTRSANALRETGPRLPVLEINTADAAAVAVVSNIDLATAGAFVAARTARNGVNITRWNILENLSLNGTPIFSPAQITQLKQTYRVSFR